LLLFLEEQQLCTLPTRKTKTANTFQPRFMLLKRRVSGTTFARKLKLSLMLMKIVAQRLFVWHGTLLVHFQLRIRAEDLMVAEFVTPQNPNGEPMLVLTRPEIGWNQLKKKHPEISYADLYTYSGVVAIEAMRGPKINWAPGRTDEPDGKKSPPDGRLPDADKGASPKTIQHVRDIFYRMGFNDQQIVALMGAHSLGRCHPNASGYDGPWTNAPTFFSNDFYRLLLDTKWTKREWNGPLQYEDPSKQLMMLPADLAMIEDPQFRKYVELYAKDEQKFTNDFASAFSTLLELGVNRNTTATTAKPTKGWLATLGLSK